jgi:hypothetical protein
MRPFDVKLLFKRPETIKYIDATEKENSTWLMWAIVQSWNRAPCYQAWYRPMRMPRARCLPCSKAVVL